jgi:outer membrane receptor protein involved in Fe transport
MTKLKLNLLTLITLFSTLSVWAQAGKITGEVKDADTQQPLSGVTIRVQGTTHGHVTDSVGKFYINSLHSGVYQLQLSYLGYEDLLIENVQVNTEAPATLALHMKPAGVMLEAVTFTVSRGRNTNQAVISEVKNAFQVVSGISQQQIKLSQDRDAAQVMSRIPGLTIVENRFVLVRGIPERYNQVLLNNAIAPSTEVDRRTFSFDLIPSSVLDRMMVYKSGSPELPGDFAGGLIKVFTNTPNQENFTSFTVGTQFRSNTTFEPYVFGRTSPTDFLGFDNGTRALPGGFPKENIRQLPNDAAVRYEAPKLLDNNLASQSQTTIPDLNFSLGLGRYWHLPKGRLQMLTHLSLSQSTSSFSRDFSRYLIQQPNQYGQPAEYRSKYVDQRYERDNRLGVLSNWSWILNPYHRIEFKNLFNQIGENSTILRSGEDFNQQAGLNRKNYMYQYRSRSIYSGQLEGNHSKEDESYKLNWVLGMNYLGENQPDLRRFRTIQTDEGSDTYRMIFPSSSNLYETGRYFGKLQEWSFNNGVNLETKLAKESERPFTLKTGYLLDYRTRQFDSRYFSYRASSTLSQEQLNAWEVLPLDQIFKDEHFSKDGFGIEEGTSPRDRYDAQNFLSAAYAGVQYPLGNFQLSGGVRLEYNRQTLSSGTDTGEPIRIENNVLSPLGSVNVDYSFNDEHKIRGGYGRSVNRPEFREIAPFLFYDYEFDLNRYGAPDLKTAHIDNYDLRYEWYPRQGETISVGGFYKQFHNPIETSIIPQGESPSFGYTNAKEGAYSYGVEFELRKSLQDLTRADWIDRLSVNLNASYIYSEVNYGAGVVGQDAKRALQGQSPYIFNAVLNYQDDPKGLQLSAAYNVVGPRIFAIGNLQFPAIYELPRHALDMTATKKLGSQFSLKVGVQDVLNAAHRYYQDTDRNRRIDTKKDDVIFHFKRGTVVSTALTYTLR